MGESVFDVLPSITASVSSSSVVQVGKLPYFLDQLKALLPIGFCLIWVQLTMFRLGAVLHYSIISSSLT